MKSGPVWKVVALVVLTIAVIAAIQYIDRFPAQRLAALSGIKITVSEVSTGTPTPRPGQSADMALASSMGTVAVQTFAGGALLRQGTGTIVSSDGLVLTTSWAAPYGQDSYVYQVATSQGSFLRARRVANDPATGLVLLKTEATDLYTVVFDESAPLDPGAHLLVTGAFLVLSRYEALRLDAQVVYVIGNQDAALSLDKTYAGQLAGARLVDGTGRSVGIVKLGQLPGIISAGAINTFLERYLSSPVKNK